jgi:glycosyltransferase involved in cell wall biosynthesis
MLLRLVAGMRERGHRSTIVTLGAREGLADAFQDLGVPVFALHLRPNPKAFVRVAALRHIVQDVQPNLVQGWMYHANLLLSLAACSLSRPPPVLWNIRRGLDDLKSRKLVTKACIKLSAVASRSAHKIIYCTARSREQHEECGFVRDHGVVINNGFVAERFYRSTQRRKEWRQQFGLADHDVAIGNVGRYDVAKGHTFLLEAFQKVLVQRPECRLVLIGRGVSPANQELQSLMTALGVSDRVVLFGECVRIEEAYSAFDIYCSSSVAEGFPNVVAEAMLSELPCVVTDTGAARELVEGVGHVVRPRDSEALAGALMRVVTTSSGSNRAWSAAQLARERVIERYALGRIIERYEQVYCSFVTSQLPEDYIRPATAAF